MSRDFCVALPRGTVGLSTVCDCGISWSYSLTIFFLSKFEIITRCIFPYVIGKISIWVLLWEFPHKHKRYRAETYDD